MVMQDDSKTILDMDIHTGFGILGYDAREEIDFWPPVIRDAEGRRMVAPLGPKPRDQLLSR